MNDYYGDFTVGSVIRIKFNTLNQALVPTTPSIAPTFAVYKNSTTEITAGITTTIDYDGKAGFHMVVIDTSADAAYVVGEDYDVVFTAGTVDSKDLTRVKLKSFSIENRNRKTNVIQVAGQTANASAAVTFPASVASPTNITQATGITLAGVTHTGAVIPTVTDVTTKSGYSLSSGGIAAIFATLTNTLTTVGSVGKLFVDNLNAAVGSIPTTPLLANDARLANLNAPINLIPTNPLLTNDTRLLNLDLPISTVNTAIGNLNNLSALINIYGSPLLEIPDAGSTLYAFTIVVRDNEGKLGNLDALPIVTASNAAGTSRSANLSSVSNPSTGRYIFTYSVSNTHPQENLRIVGSGTVSGEGRYVEWIGSVVNYDTLTTLQSVQTTVNSINTRLPALPAAVSDIPTANQNRDAVMNAMPSGGWVNGSFGDRWIISDNSNRTIGVTGAGSGHVQVDVHQMQPNVMTASALATDAVTEIVTGVWTQNLSSFGANTAGKNLFDIYTNVLTLLTRIPAATAQLVTDLAFMLVGSGTSLVRWTVQALSLAPSGGGGGGGGASVTVTPEAFINLDNTLLEKNVFTFFNNEARTYLVTLASGTFDGQPMTFCLEKSDKTNLLVVTGLTSVTNSVSVTISAVAEQTDKCMFWSLRDSATGRIILYGPAVQKYAAFNN